MQPVALCCAKKRTRKKLKQSLANTAPCLIGMEACAGAHHVGRELKKLGHQVKLLPAQYVKPYLKDTRTTTAMLKRLPKPSSGRPCASSL